MAKIKPTNKLTEEQLASIAKAATGSAYKRALRIGSVVVYRNGELRRVEAGGTSSLVKKMKPRTRLDKGSRIEIKPVEV